MTPDHHPVQNSEVYIPRASHVPSVPPPSPPSSSTQCEREPCPPMDDLGSMTPPEFPELSDSWSSSFVGRASKSYGDRLSNAVHVLGTEAEALSCLTRLYETDPVARRGFNVAVEAITRYGGDKGQLIICGIGKSGHIAKKMVATMNSLKIRSTYLHPTEALHGDLGVIGRYDTILLITFSGKTPELLSLLPHFDTALPLLIMTSHTHPSTCEIIKQRPNAILLPAPIHKSETASFGFNAPTTSTTMALALGDALAVVISNDLHLNVQAVFSQNHPGGAIGQAVQGPKKISDLTILFETIPEMDHRAITGAHVLMSAYKSTSGWVRQGDDMVISPRRITELQPGDMKEPATCIKGLMVPSKDWIEVTADISILSAQEWIRKKRRDGETNFSDDAILAMIVEGEVAGVIEIGTVME